MDAGVSAAGTRRTFKAGDRGKAAGPVGEHGFSLKHRQPEYRKKQIGPSRLETVETDPVRLRFVGQARNCGGAM
ncbi:hypothetical protein [Paenibacillus xanthanilyticus]|uniref:Uncharacterized protein n=1 Tax=Paenibacillus xanthanilyticus TaxID=1783531 RepID=A0ABV8K1L6_9BACL